jgi:FkbM family methyltransferase
VYAFEARPENAAVLRQNVALNQLEERVIVEACAVHDGSAGSVMLAQGLTSFEHAVVAPARMALANERPLLEVPAVALDEYFHGQNCLDFVKMDIEGAEQWAIKGMARILREVRPTCLIELHGYARMPVIMEFVEVGYDLQDLNGGAIDMHGPGEQIIHIVALPPS